MQSILNFWLIIFWLTWLIFFLSTSNLIKLFITSEIVWILLYLYSLLLGVHVDDVHLYSMSLLLISLASVEFSIGFVLIIFFKKIFKSADLADNINSDWSTIERLRSK